MTKHGNKSNLKSDSIISICNIYRTP